MASNLIPPLPERGDPFLKAVKRIWREWHQSLGHTNDFNFPITNFPSPKKLFKELKERGLVREKTRPVLWDPKQKKVPDPDMIEYRDQRIPTAFLKLAVLDFPKSIWKEKEPLQAYFIVEAHPLWALPGTVALGIHPNFSYVGAQLGDSLWIFSESLLDPLRNHLNFQEDRLRIHLPGERIIGWHLKAPLGPDKIPVIANPNINLEHGTGLSLVLPSYRASDYELSQQTGLPQFDLIDGGGRFTPEIREEFLIGEEVFSSVAKILKFLKKNNFLIKEEEKSLRLPFLKGDRNPLLFKNMQGEYLTLDIPELKNKTLDQIRRLSWDPPWARDEVYRWVEKAGDLEIDKGFSQQNPGPHSIGAGAAFGGQEFLGTEIPRALMLWTALEQDSPFQKIFIRAPYDPKDLEHLEKLDEEALIFWAASMDFRKSLPTHAAHLEYLDKTRKKIQRILHFIHKNLEDFDPSRDKIPFSNRTVLDQWLLGQWGELADYLKKEYGELRLHHVSHSLVSFAKDDLSSFYLEANKDVLYFSEKNDPARRSIQSTLQDLTHYWTPYWKPLLPQTLTGLPVPLPVAPPQPEQEIKATIEKINIISHEIHLALEQAKIKKLIKSDRGAQVRVMASDDWQKFLQEHTFDWPKYFGVSQVVVVYELEDPTYRSETLHGLSAKVLPAEGNLCSRCGNYSTTVRSAPDRPPLCSRCKKALNP